MQQGSVVSDGLDIHYAVTGQGPAVVLVHGWGSDAEGNWVQTGWVEALAPLRRVVMLDVRGHGASDKPLQADRYGYAAMAGDVLSVMDHLDIERADYLGYSMGAFMGAWLLGHHTERWRSMTLGGVGRETEASIALADRIAAALRADDPAAIDDPLGIAYRRFVDADPRIDAADREALAVSALQMWPDGDAVALGGPGLAQVEAPVLAVVGADDAPYIDTVQEFIDAVPGARLLTLPGRDHLGAVTAPEFRDAVRSLLASG